MTDELVHYAVADAVATITLDSPHNRNALSRQLVTELFERARARGGRLRGEGGAGPAGGQGLLLRRRPLRGDHGGMAEGARRIVALQRLIVTLDKPVVTRVSGAVRAGGIGIVAASDIAISADDATYALTEVKLGLAAAIISLTVHARMNPRAASLTTLGGETFSGTQAAAYGLVTTAVPADQPGRGGRDDLSPSSRPGRRRGCASPSGSSTPTWYAGSTRRAPTWPS